MVVTGQEPLFFVDRMSDAPEGARRDSLELKNFAGRPVDGLYFGSQRALRDARRHAAIATGN